MAWREKCRAEKFYKKSLTKLPTLCKIVNGGRMKAKKYYSAGKVIKMLGICRKTLYNWEVAGKVPKAKRESFSSYRYYTAQDVEKIRKLMRKK